MVNRLHHTYLIIGVLALGFLAVMQAKRALCVMTLITLFAYVTQLLMLIYFSREKAVHYTEKALFWIVILYGLMMATIFMLLSYSIDGDTFMFCKRDAIKYYDNSMLSSEIGFVENASRIIRKFDSGDYGMFLFSSFLMYLIPSKLFLNAVYLLTGAVSSIMLYRMGQIVMPKMYAFEAALAYGTSSFLIFFHCTFLKESLFVFLIIASMYYFYVAAVQKNYFAFTGVVICLGLIVFFRPAVTAMLAVSMAAYFAISQRGSALSLFLYMMIAIGLVASVTFLQEQVDRYTLGGDMDAIVEDTGTDNYSGSFNVFVSWFAAPFGPFPSLFPNAKSGIGYINFFGAGVLYKLFLVLPFWMGVFFALKQFNMDLITMIVFIVVEMLASGYVLASLELRKVMPHVPFMYILSFYGFYQIEKSDMDKTIQQWFELGGYAFVLGVLLLWNVIKVKG